MTRSVPVLGEELTTSLPSGAPSVSAMKTVRGSSSEEPSALSIGSVNVRGCSSLSTAASMSTNGWRHPLAVDEDRAREVDVALVTGAGRIRPSRRAGRS